MFIGREKELNKLNELYNKSGFQFSVIYGRRRVGKTALINEFMNDKEAIFFTGIESSAQQNLVNISRCILSYANEALGNTFFPSFQAALEYVFRLAKKKRIVFAIDEFPYIARASKSLASILQALIDENKDTSKLFLILCGSSISFMENNVLAFRAPLYGRRTAQFKIQPFDYYESRSFFRKYSDIDIAAVYGIVGGIPQYLLQIDDSLSLEENIKRCLFEPSSPLFEEPDNLLMQEVREPAIYNAIIAAIATGSTRLSEISVKVGEETSACAVYLKNLITFGIIKKVTPITENSARKTMYKVDDSLYRFWHKFIPDNIAAINRGLADSVFRKISPKFSDYMEDAFEEICIQYLWKLRMHGKAPVEFTDLGCWWGNDAKNKCEIRIDIMGTDGADSAIFCGCKWTNEKTDIGVLNVLVEKSLLFRYKNVRFYLFAKSGFTKRCSEKANELGNVALVPFAEIANYDGTILPKRGKK